MQEIVTKKMGYNLPTPIQAYTIPAVLSGADVTGISQTGESLQYASIITHANVQHKAPARPLRTSFR
jgi:superfamily II DNA/RNA helicase